MTATILDIQKALKAHGFDPGPLDGERGRKTIAAVTAFQASVGLKADGLVGPATLAKLIPDAAGAGTTVAAHTPWLGEAYRLIGLKEDTGPGSNAQILQMAKDLGVSYKDDEVPWCGLFVAHCIGSQLPHEPLPSNPLGARAYQRFGHKVDPQPGAVMVFWRESLASGKGHVGFYAGETAEGAFLILGGNQGDAVSIVAKPRDRFLEARWPVTALPATGGKVIVADAPGRERVLDQQEV